MHQRLVILCLMCIIAFAAWPAAMQDDTAEPITADNVANLTTIMTLEGHTEGVTDVAFSPDGAWLASVGDDTALRLWSVATGEPTAEVYEHGSFVKSVMFDPNDSSRLASGAWDRTIWIWEQAEGDLTPQTLLEDFGGIIDPVRFSPDGTRLAFGVGDGTARVIDLAGDADAIVFELDALQVTDMAFNPDGTLLATAGGFPDSTAQIWDIQNEERSARLEGHAGAVTALAFSPDGEVIATGGDDSTLRLWQDAEEIAMFELEDWVTDLAFSPDGALLAVALQNGDMVFWDLEASEVVATLSQTHAASVNALTFNADGTLLASAGEDSSLRLWQAAME